VARVEVVDLLCEGNELWGDSMTPYYLLKFFGESGKEMEFDWYQHFLIDMVGCSCCI
jgi:hypothetical protein